jgi:ACS family hexuronate transporter-like MFS transporter
MALKWRLCLLLFLATTLNYLDRQTLSILAPILQKEMGLDNAALGWLFAVFYAYMFSQIAAGPLLDRLHLRWVFGAAVLLWSVVSAATGLASGFVSLIVFRLLLGITEAANWPVAIRIVARTMEPRKRSLGNGIFTSGTSVGALVAPALILGIASAMGWRWAFILLGAAAAVWFIGWILSTRTPELRPVWQDAPGEPGAAGESVVRVVRQIVKSPRFVPVLVVSVLVNRYLYFSVNWLPTYFAQQRGLSPGGQLAWILTAIYLGLDLGNLLCGAGILALTRRGQPLLAARRIVLLGATAPLVACALVPLLPGVGTGGFRPGGREYRVGSLGSHVPDYGPGRFEHPRFDRTGPAERVWLTGRRGGDVGGREGHSTDRQLRHSHGCVFNCRGPSPF